MGITDVFSGINTSLPTTDGELPKWGGGGSGAFNGIKGIFGAMGGGSDPISMGLSMIPGVGPFASGGYNLMKSIAPMFKKSQAGIQKETATQNQQAIEQQAKEIETRVMNGTLSPSIGLKQIQALRASLGAGGNEYDKRGGAMAALTLNNIESNLRQKAANNLSNPLDKTGGAGFTGTNSETRDRIVRAFQNYGMGMQQGNEDLKGSPFEKVFKTSDTLGNAYQALGQVNKMFPQTTNPNTQMAANTFSNRIADKLNKFGGA